MRLGKTSVTVLALLFIAAQPPTADLVLRGGAVYTLDASRSWVEAIAVRQGRIVYVGSGVGADPWVGPATSVVDLEGKMVLPSFQDSHVHPVSGGIELGQCDLNGLATAREVLETIRQCVAETPAGGWVVGGGWHLPLFPQANPTRELLDEVVGDRPAYLTAMDGHSAWVSSRALAIAGIDRTTPDPAPDGRIERDATGEPSGTLREAAMKLVSQHVPRPTPAEHLAGLRRALELAARFGITALHEARADSEEILEAYAELDRRGELSARVVAALEVDPQKGAEQVDELIRKRSRYSGRRLQATAAKIFADGVIESRTAALLAPYLDQPGDRGRPNFEPEALNRLVSRLDQEGFQVHIHAIGDRGIRMSLDALEAAEKANGRRDARHTIAHLELIDPADIPRFRDLGIIANFQPLWAYADTYITELTEPKLGPERSRWLYPIGSVARSGAVIVGGSDWSVTSMNPLEAIQVALTRRGIEDSSGEPFIPEERVDLATMLAAYTINGAYLSHEEKERGSLEVGKSADLLVVDRNLFAIPPAEVHRARVLLTLLEGKEVYRDERFRPGSAVIARGRGGK